MAADKGKNSMFSPQLKKASLFGSPQINTVSNSTFKRMEEKSHHHAGN